MKTVLLLRHAKSDWGEAGLADFDRPLATRGEKDAPLMGQVLAKFDYMPDQIISSPAKRARQTSQLVAKACGYQPEIDWADSFYGGGSEDLIGALRRLPDSVERPLLVGHNPTLEETVADMLVGPDASWQESMSIKLPTAGLVCLDLPITEWRELVPGQAVLRWFLIPRLVKAIL
ncbi:MAG: hypothetical protein FOGNACKC_04248 [Anaerolineae bacterium]|nr:hypothetical protein [Anaerolineae bacterium]